MTKINTKSLEKNWKTSDSILFTLLFLTSCGLQKFNDVIDMVDKPYDVQKTDPTFDSYIKNFETDFKVNVEVPIVFKEMNNKYAGVCYSWSDGYREININKNYWKDYSKHQREQLIYHELGHCFGNLKHDDSFLGDCPKSIMYSFMFNNFQTNNCYLPNRESYIIEMYNKIF